MWLFSHSPNTYGSFTSFLHFFFFPEESALFIVTGLAGLWYRVSLALPCHHLGPELQKLTLCIFRPEFSCDLCRDWALPPLLSDASERPQICPKTLFFLNDTSRRSGSGQRQVICDPSPPLVFKCNPPAHPLNFSFQIDLQTYHFSLSRVLVTIASGLDSFKSCLSCLMASTLAFSQNFLTQKQSP